MLLFPGTDYSEAEALIITFSLNNFPADDPRMAQARLWEEAFLKEMQAFQSSTADKFQVAFSAEVGTLQSSLFCACSSLMLWGQFQSNPHPCSTPS